MDVTNRMQGSAGKQPTRTGISRRQVLRLTVGAIAALSVLLVLVACGATATEAPAAVESTAVPPTAVPVVEESVDPLVIAVSSEPQSLDPQAIELRTPQVITSNIYEALVNRQRDGSIIPWLAESWEQVDPLTLRFKLRPGVKFHNGEPFNADSVVYSMDRILNPEFASQFSGFFGNITGATKVDDLTVDINTSAPDAVLLSRLYMFQMMAPKWTEEAGDLVASTANGTGPYKFVDWQRNVEIDLVRNDDYWGGTPEIDSAKIRIIGEDSTRMQALITGELDLYLGPLPDQLDELPKYASALAPVYSFLRLSTFPDSTVADPLVRQAMNYAIDKEQLLEQLHAGLGKVLQGQITSAEVFGFNPNLQPYPYDLDKAKALLEEAGAVGLELEYIGPKGNYTGDAIEAQAIAEMLNQAGFKVNLNLVDTQTWIRYGDRAQTSPPPAIWYVRHDNLLFDSDRTTSGYYTDETTFSSYYNPETIPLVEAARSELDEEKREKIYWEIYEIGRENPTGVFLFQHVDLWGMSERLNFEPRPDGRPLIFEMSFD
ncbi:ABC transporter substrate-binding protein [Chloroflexota bacterium]